MTQPAPCSYARFVVRCPILCLVLFFAAGEQLIAEDWPQFLGPQRNGVSNEKGLIDQWPADGLKVAWRAEGGVGMASVVVHVAL